MLDAAGNGRLSPEELAERFAEISTRQLGFAQLDVQRELRQAAPEAVLASGKTPEEVVEIVEAMDAGGAGSILVTRASEPVRAAS